MTRPLNASIECRRATDSGHQAVRAVFEGLSGESRLMRFHVSTPRLREGHVRALSRVEPGVQDVVLAWVGAGQSDTGSGTPSARVQPSWRWRWWTHGKVSVSDQPS